RVEPAAVAVVRVDVQLAGVPAVLGHVHPARQFDSRLLRLSRLHSDLLRRDLVFRPAVGRELIGAGRDGQLGGPVAVEVAAAAPRAMQTSRRTVEAALILPEGETRNRWLAAAGILHDEAQQAGRPAVIHAVESYRGLLAAGHLADNERGGSSAVVGVDEPLAV